MIGTSRSIREYLSVEEIEEIHCVFVLLDTDGSGILTVDKLRLALQAITKNSDISLISFPSLFAQMDMDQDGRVTWTDFLNFMCYWLFQFGVVRPKLRSDLPINSFEQEILHKSIAGILANGYIQCSQLHTDSLEARTETWDYLGESKMYSSLQKQQYLQNVFRKIEEWEFLRIIQQLKHNDLGVVKSALEELKEILGILSCFESSYDRKSISGCLLSLFQHIITKNLLGIVISFLAFDSDKEIQWQALNIITFIAPGPRLPNYSEESKNCVEYCKKVLMQTGALLKILLLCENECIEVRGQALLAMGFITRYDNEIRDFLYKNGALSVLLGLLKKGLNKVMDVSSLVRAAWVLSIFSGATMSSNQTLPLSIRQQDLQDIAETVVNLFQTQDESNLLANSLISLSFILPELTITNYNRWILERLVQLMSHQDFIVKKAVLQTTRNVICQNTDQCRILTELGLHIKIYEILEGRQSSLKLDACNILRFLIFRGHSWEILNPSRLGSQLQSLITTDKETRWEAIRVIKQIISSNTKIAIEYHLYREIARLGLIRTIFQALLYFKEVSSVLSDIYGNNCISYNFGYLNDCLLALDSFIITGWVTGDYKLANNFLQYLQAEQANLLIEVVRILIEECKKGKELYQIYYAEVNVRTT
jgi:EF-hand domain pair